MPPVPLRAALVLLALGLGLCASLAAAAPRSASGPLRPEPGPAELVRQLAAIAPKVHRPALEAAAARLGRSRATADLREPLTQALHLAGWTGEVLRRSSSLTKRKALARVRQEVFAAVALGAGAGELKQRMSEAVAFGKAYSLGELIGMGSRAREREYLGLFVRRELRAGLLALGRAEQLHTHQNHGRVLESVLEQLIPLLGTLSGPQAARLLERTGEELQARFAAARVDPRRVYAGPIVEWTAGDLERLLGGERRAWAEQERLPLLKGAAAGMTGATRDGLLDILGTFRHPRVASRLGRVLRQEGFRRQPAQAQLAGLACLAQTIETAETTAALAQRANLRNAVRPLLSGRYTVAARSLEPTVLGQAGSGVCTLNLDRLRPGHTGEAADTLSHEVSHLRSGQRVEESARYFEEEYRAWMVGFLGGHGRAPTRQEAAERTLFLLEGGPADSAYQYIARAFQRDPRAFAPYLTSIFGVASGDLGGGAARAMAKLRAVNHLPGEAPQWGWPGFLLNQRRPRSTSRR